MAENYDTELKSIEERDRQWLATIYRGDEERNLTVRSVAGMIFGGLMSLSNLYESIMGVIFAMLLAFGLL
jgi:hypothetical protein